MERLYSGRIKIDDADRFSIEVPPKRNLFVIILILIWLVGWVKGELFAFDMLIESYEEGCKSDDLLFYILYIIGWTVGGLLVIRSLLWIIAGKEIIIFSKDQLIVSKKRAFLRPKVYDLKEIKNFDLNPGTDSGDFFGVRHNMDMLRVESKGMFKFNYGKKTIKIANGLDENEGRLILNKIKEKNLLKGD
jgi:hypothetical protein